MHSIILVTCPDADVAHSIGEELLNARLIACVNIVENVTSMFWWEGEIHRDKEVMMIIKTKKDLFEAVRSKVQKMHPYDVPEILELDITDGHKPYLDWVTGETGGE